MSAQAEIIDALQELLREILERYDEKVAEEGPFNDLRVKRQLQFGDPSVTMAGLLELTVMHMEDQLNPSHRTIRFIAVRVKKSPRGGAVSSTCLHGTKEELRFELERELRHPELLLERVEELASGLPEETNPGFWR